MWNVRSLAFVAQLIMTVEYLLLFGYINNVDTTFDPNKNNQTQFNTQRHLKYIELTLA